MDLIETFFLHCSSATDCTKLKEFLLQTEESDREWNPVFQFIEQRWPIVHEIISSDKPQESLKKQEQKRSENLTTNPKGSSKFVRIAYYSPNFTTLKPKE
jgi:hypothetical protein